MVRGLHVAVVVLFTSGVFCLTRDLSTPRRGTPPALLPRGQDESAEVLCAQVEVKKAHVRAAEVALRGAKGEREVETAAAQLGIRTAELREAEARLKQANAQPAAAAATAVGVFNMATLMRGYDRAKYQVYLLNEKRQGESATIATKKAEHTRLAQRVAVEVGDAKEKAAAELKALSREIEDEEARINKMLNDEASVIISHLYDEIKTVVDDLADKKGYQLIFAYPDAVTEEDTNNPYLKELKLKPPAAQPFFVARTVDLTDEVLRKLNATFPARDENGKKVDVSKLPVLPPTPVVPKRD